MDKDTGKQTGSRMDLIYIIKIYNQDKEKLEKQCYEN